MRIIGARWPFALLILGGIIVLLVSLADMVLQKGWYMHLLVAYAILIILAVVLIVLVKVLKPAVLFKETETPEKPSRGEINHFKCPSCDKFFAVQATSPKQQHPMKTSCPHCSIIGVIPLTPETQRETIPEGTSEPVRFKCTNCEEEVVIWAEGADITEKIHPVTCPNCGKQNTLQKTQ